MQLDWFPYLLILLTSPSSSISCLLRQFTVGFEKGMTRRRHDNHEVPRRGEAAGAEYIQILIRNSFIHKDGNRRYKYLVFRSRGTLFCNGTLWFEEQVHRRRHHQDIFVVFAGKVYQHIIGIPMGTNCAQLLVDIFLLLIRSGIHTVLALDRWETVGISVQLHI